MDGQVGYGRKRRKRRMGAEEQSEGMKGAEEKKIVRSRPQKQSTPIGKKKIDDQVMELLEQESKGNRLSR